MQKIFKTTGLLALLVFAIGIIFLSSRANQVEAKGFGKNGHRIMGHMMNSDFSQENHTRLTPEQKQVMIDLMKQHHGENWQSHHQQMHGYQNGT